MIEHVRDFRRVKKFFAADEGSVSLSRDTFYLMEVVDGVDKGMWSLYPCGGGIMIHVDMAVDFRGKKAAVSAQNAFSWVFANTPHVAVYATIPVQSRAVCVLASHVGMEFYLTDDEFRYYCMSKDNFSASRLLEAA